MKLSSGEWFSDSCEGTGNDKDSLMQLHNSWIIELAEFDRFLNKQDASDLNKSVSVREDKFRLPYGKGVETFKRKFVMCGTTNKDEFLIDPTGNRRYWIIPVAIPKIDIQWIKQHRDEIWAAAVHLYNQGHEWFLNDEEKHRQVQLMKPFELSDTWEEYIEAYLIPRSFVTIPDILLNCLQIPIGQQKKSDQMRVADILKRMGWVKKDLRRGDQRKGWAKHSCGGQGKGAGRGLPVEDNKTLIKQDLQEMSPTSPTFSQQNNSTPENNNQIQNPKIEIQDSIHGGQVEDNLNPIAETQSDKGT